MRSVALVAFFAAITSQGRRLNIIAQSSATANHNSQNQSNHRLTSDSASDSFSSLLRPFDPTAGWQLPGAGHVHSLSAQTKPVSPPTVWHRSHTLPSQHGLSMMAKKKKGKAAAAALAALDRLEASGAMPEGNDPAPVKKKKLKKASSGKASLKAQALAALEALESQEQSDMEPVVANKKKKIKRKGMSAEKQGIEVVPGLTPTNGVEEQKNGKSRSNEEEKEEKKTQEEVLQKQKQDPQLMTLRNELETLKRRALEAGVGQEELDKADDADDVKSALIALILDAKKREIADANKKETQNAGLVSLRAELELLKPRALKQRAAEVGVDPELVDEADDADDVKGTLITLILDREGEVAQANQKGIDKERQINAKEKENGKQMVGEGNQASLTETMKEKEGKKKGDEKRIVDEGFKALLKETVGEEKGEEVKEAKKKEDEKQMTQEGKEKKQQIVDESFQALLRETMGEEKGKEEKEAKKKEDEDVKQQEEIPAARRTYIEQIQELLDAAPDKPQDKTKTQEKINQDLKKWGLKPKTQKRINTQDGMERENPKSALQITESSQPKFVSLRLDKVSLWHGTQEVLSDASWEVRTGQRVGLVGANGCGKSTQLKILGGEITPTSGKVIKSNRKLRISFLKQEFIDDIDVNRTLREEFKTVLGKGDQVMKDLARAEAELALPETIADPEKMNEVLDRMADLQEESERLDADEIEFKVDRVMAQMGFAAGEADALVGSFSGGWKMRIGLGKILLQDPNILLLDEPTNHLDLETVEWLENFLVEQKLPMVIVSHDREFLDRTCNKIVETLEGVAYAYDGDYSKFLELKDIRWESWQAAYDNQQKFIKAEEKWIRMNKKREGFEERVRSRQSELDKLLKGPDYVSKPPRKQVRFSFRFPESEQRILNQAMAKCKKVTHGYGDQNLFEGFSMSVVDGDRAAFLGPNGAGKSTLFRVLMGLEEPRDGMARVNPKVSTTFYAQSQADELDLDDTVVGVIQKAAPIDYNTENIRQLLSKFLFRGDAVNKKIRGLSGGEKARVALARMMLTPSSLLIMDEPTNHLDIPAKEMLEEALQHFDGTLLLISHDRYFLSKVATKIYALENRRFKLYNGDYYSYLMTKPGYADKLGARYKEGISREIERAKVIQVEVESERQLKKKKNFGGSQQSVVKTKKKMASRMS